MKGLRYYLNALICLSVLGFAFYSCTEEPAPIAVSSVTLDSTSMTLEEGEEHQLTVAVSPYNADNKVVIWTSSNSSVASVNDGLVKAIKSGKATITVKSDDGGKTASCEVTVNEKINPVESVSLDKTSYEMTEGEEFTLTATIKPDNATNQNVTWSSSNTSVATVDHGRVTALKSGTAKIKVTTEDGGKTAACTVTVNEKVYPVESVSLDKTSYEMTEGEEFTLTATIKPDNATNTNVTWSSSNTSVTTVSNGKVTAKKAGTTTITVKTEDGGKTATCTVYVYNSSRTDLSSAGTANCYIVSSSGSYKFTPTKGRSSISVGTISSVEVLWETYGTHVVPSVGSLIKSVNYKDGAIEFDTASTYKEGNAVIAAKNSRGEILWSWHIWFTDEPKGQVYYNNAGTMMDRNLGATSATPGDVGALGLLYQWGRKDPFLGSSSISSNTEAKSTITWPSAVSSNLNRGTIEYATSHPTTFITFNTNNNDWHYTGSSSTDNTRWTTSSSKKSIYDPCPPGWRVPDGGKNGVWSKALGSSSSFDYTYNSSKEGMNFSGKFGSSSTIWYPSSGYRDEYPGSLDYVGNYGTYWSATPNTNYGASCLYFNENGGVFPTNYYGRAYAWSVRCIKSID